MRTVLCVLRAVALKSHCHLSHHPQYYCGVHANQVMEVFRWKEQLWFFAKWPAGEVPTEAWRENSRNDEVKYFVLLKM